MAGHGRAGAGAAGGAAARRRTGTGTVTSRLLALPRGVLGEFCIPSVRTMTGVWSVG